MGAECSKPCCSGFGLTMPKLPCCTPPRSMGTARSNPIFCMLYLQGKAFQPQQLNAFLDRNRAAQPSRRCSSILRGLRCVKRSRAPGNAAFRSPNHAASAQRWGLWHCAGCHPARNGMSDEIRSVCAEAEGERRGQKQGGTQAVSNAAAWSPAARGALWLCAAGKLFLVVS